MSEPLKYLILIFFTIFLAAGVYIFQPISAGVEAFTKTKPCSQPFTYSIGEIDPRFAISSTELEEAVEAAVHIWNNGTETTLLTKQDVELQESDILIRLVYDGRQKRTDSELRFRERIQTRQIRLDQQQAQHDNKRDRFEERSRKYRNLAERTTERLDELNAWVAEKNDGGGFRESDLEQFERKKEKIERDQQHVREERRQLDQLAQNINKEMDELNEKFDEHNQLIEQYNEEFAGDLRFTKATYQKAADSGVVTVNQFMNKKELTLILAHELGHALGLNHLDLPASIMYSKMGAQQLNPFIQLTQADEAAVLQLCN